MVQVVLFTAISFTVSDYFEELQVYNSEVVEQYPLSLHYISDLQGFFIFFFHVLRNKKVRLKLVV